MQNRQLLLIKAAFVHSSHFVHPNELPVLLSAFCKLERFLCSSGGTPVQLPTNLLQCSQIII